jgi:hypothetical protein
MLRLSSKITVAGETSSPIIFDFVNEVEISEGWENLTDTCKIVIPRKLTFQGKDIAIGDNAIFKRGQTIKVELGYDGVLKTAFQGYISRVHLALPLMFECEDEMYVLKKNTLANKSWDGVSLSTLLKYIMPSGVSYTTNGFSFTNLGKIRISNNATTAMVLDMLKRNYQVFSFYRNRKLYIGLPYQVSLRKNRTFDFEKNIIEDKSLEYMRDEDVKIKVKAVSITPDNKKTEAFWPSEDAEGEQKTIHKYNISESDLQAEAKRYYETFKYEGYRGSFVTFGEPYTNHGDGVQLLSTKLPEREKGVYLVRSVKRTFGQNGYRQQIELANRIT